MTTKLSVFDRISRRRFLETTFAAGMTAAAGSSLLLPQRARAQDTQIRKGGELRLAYPNAVDSIDPFSAGSTSALLLSSAIYDNLTAFAADGVTIVPQLATEWRPEAQGQEWVLTLRQGVRFHHGTEFTSADVVATIERTLDQTTAGRARGVYGPVESVRAEGPHTVRVILSQPFVDFPVSCAGRWARILPADRIDQQAELPTGTGPFKLDSHEQGTATRIVRNEEYWDADRPHLDAITFFPIAESVSQQAAISGGAVDIINQIGSETYMALRNTAGVTAWSQPSGRYQTVYTLNHLAPFEDWRARLAFKLLLDRPALLQSALFGEGVIGNDVQLLPTHPWMVDLPVHNQDLPRARALLDEAGLGSFSLDIWTSSERPPLPRVALALQQAAAQIGVTLNIRDIPFSDYIANVPRQQPLYTSQWSESKTSFELFYAVHHTAGFANYSRNEMAPGTDVLIETILAEVDPERRKELVGELLPVIHERSDRIIPYFQNFFASSRDNVQGFNPVELFELRDIWLSA